MAFKFVALIAFVASAAAGVIPSGQVVYSAPATVVKAAPLAYSAPASYSGYSASAEYAQQASYPSQVAYAQPVAVVKSQPVLTKAVEEYDPHPQYKFGYDVQDTLSGDSKSQVETRDGDLVQGEYSLIDADGYKRTVQYTADSVHGFNAVVNREPVNVALKAVAAPVIIKAAPVAYAPASVAYAPAPKQLSYAARQAQVAYTDGPVVKGAYAATPIVKAAPVAYPLSDEH